MSRMQEKQGRAAYDYISGASGIWEHAYRLHINVPFKSGAKSAKSPTRTLATLDGKHGC